ncbi:MAG: hypothetical protein Q9181_004055 [Wetmoreana brouardii]
MDAPPEGGETHFPNLDLDASAARANLVLHTRRILSSLDCIPHIRLKYFPGLDHFPDVPFFLHVVPGVLGLATMATLNRSRVIGTLGRALEPCYNGDVDRLRHEEYPMLNDSVYLDHASTTLYPKSLIEQSSRDLIQNLFGNPHSGSPSSQLSTRRIEDVRLRALRFFHADPEYFDLVFVAGATAGIKLVMDGFKDYPGGFWYGYHWDAHTSLIGVRENATEHRCFANDEEVDDWIQAQPFTTPLSHNGPVALFAYPAQSNLNGRRLPLSWPGLLRSSCDSYHRKVYSLLDAAALVSTSPLDLSDASQAPDFTVLSFYKIFGYPDLGALVVRKDSSHPLSRRRYFGGGTVEMVTCTSDNWHIKKQGSLHEQLEDGTLPFHSIIALDSAFDVHEKLFGSLGRISSHTSFLASRLYRDLSFLRHVNGLPVCTIYKDPSSSYEDGLTQGPIIALNLRNSNGRWISNAEVEKLATIKNIQFRTGGLCNPGGVASSLDLAPWEMKRNFSAGQRCGNEDDILGGKPTGIIRLSLGAMSNMRDVAAFVQFVEEFFVDRQRCPEPTVSVSSGAIRNLYVESLHIYPIKSCGAWQVPSSLDWDLRSEGLAWDREWCLVHQGTRAALSQKRVPRMALIHPSLDLEGGVLRVRYAGQLPSSVPNEIVILLSDDPTPFQDPTAQCSGMCSSRVCGDFVSAHTYTSPQIAAFFTAALSTPCTLVRLPPGPSSRHSKPHLQRSKHRIQLIASPPAPSIPGAFPTPPPSPPTPHETPILLSNESPILTISRSSLKHLNQIITQTSPYSKPIPASVFRANIILAQSGPESNENPYDEDNWTALHILPNKPLGSENSTPATPTPALSGHTIELNVLAPCRRCQMVCIDQTTAERREEPFLTLAKTRRRDGGGEGERAQKGVFFGVHCALSATGEKDGGERRRRIRVGDRVLAVREGDDAEGEVVED